MQEQQFEVDFTIPYTNQKVKINAEHFEANQTKINCEDIIGLKYGVSLIGTPKKPIKKIYTIAVKDKNGKTAEIKFESQKATELLAEDHTYFYLMNSVWYFVKKKLVADFIEKLNNKEFLEVSNAKFNHQGFEYQYKTWLFGKTKTGILPWSQTKFYLNKGIFYIQDQNRRKRKFAFSLHNDWNAVIMQTLMHYLSHQNRILKLEKGDAIELIVNELAKRVA